MNEKDENVGWKFWKKRRYILGALVFFGFFTSNILRVNLSIAIVVMTTPSEGQLKPEFDWSRDLQGEILSSFFKGYMLTQFFGGWLSSLIGGKKVLGVGIGATAFLTLISPPIARTNVYLFILVRILEGLFEGVTFPSVNAIWANWAPVYERSKLATLAFSGSTAAAVVAMPVSSVIANRFGWAAVFYIYGIFGLIWSGLWWYIVTDDPADDPWISPAELDYIKKSLKTSDNIDEKKISHPWKEILKSRPFWAIVVAHFCEMWGYLTMVTQLPSFLSDVLHYEIEKTGFISALPYLGLTTVMVFSGHLADYLQLKNYLTTTQVRKIFTCIAFLGQTIILTMTGFLTNEFAIVASIVIALCVDGLSTPGYIVNYLDIAPQHASVLLGMGKTIATIPGIVSPRLTGHIVKNKSAAEWRIVLIIMSSVYLFGALVYGIFASGEKQKWAEESREKIPINRCKTPTDVNDIS